MKKIIGILGVAVIAAMMFLTTNVLTGSKSDVSLASLIAVNTANAQSETNDGPFSYGKELVPEKVYDTVYSISGSASLYVEVPVGAKVTGTYYNHFIGTMKSCDWAVAKCDQSKVGFYPASGVVN